jgi:hypothetical protein
MDGDRLEGRQFNGSAAAQPRSGGKVATEVKFQSVAQPMPAGPKHFKDSQWIVGPGKVALLRAEAVNGAVIVCLPLLAAENKALLRKRRCMGCDSKIEGDAKDLASIVISVVADEFNPAWGSGLESLHAEKR